MLTLRPSWFAEESLREELWDGDGNVRMPILAILASAVPEGWEEQCIDDLLSLIDEMRSEGSGRHEIACALLRATFGTIGPHSTIDAMTEATEKQKERLLLSDDDQSDCSPLLFVGDPGNILYRRLRSLSRRVMIWPY